MDNLDISFARICEVAGSSPELEPMAKAFILSLDYIRRLELRLAKLESRLQHEHNAKVPGMFNGPQRVVNK